MRNFSLHLGDTISSVLVELGRREWCDEKPTGRDYRLLPTALGSE